MNKIYISESLNESFREMLQRTASCGMSGTGHTIVEGESGRPK